uniref:Aquaporin n=1 Tax=Syphacia muris TaxID=451379 RepID=A0A0N5AGN4_9BILA
MRLWIASLLFYMFVYLVCEILRLLIKITFRWKPQNFSRRLLLEFVGTLQICAPMFDINIILDSYGLYGVFIEVSFLELANTILFRDAIAHPCALVLNKRPNTFRQALMVFIAEMLAGFSSFFLARFFWSFGIHQIHRNMLQLDTCDADLTVAILIGCLIEGVATFSSKAVEYYSKYQDVVKPTILNCFFSGFLTVLGIKYTGLYANPIVAWSCTFNCEGLTHLGHLAVYWIAPIIGWHFADVVFSNADCDLTYDRKDSKKE